MRLISNCATCGKLSLVLRLATRSAAGVTSVDLCDHANNDLGHLPSRDVWMNFGWL